MRFFNCINWSFIIFTYFSELIDNCMSRHFSIKIIDGLIKNPQSIVAVPVGVNFLNDTSREILQNVSVFVFFFVKSKVLTFVVFFLPILNIFIRFTV